MRNTLILLVILFTSFIPPSFSKDREFPPIPRLSNLVGAISYENGSKEIVVIEVYRQRDDIWMVKVPRGMLGEEFADKKHSAWSLLPLVLFNVKFECSINLYTRDVNYDYYLVKKH